MASLDLKPMPAPIPQDDLPLRDVPEPEPVYHEPERPVEIVWREGFQLLYACLLEMPSVVSAWAYWRVVDGDLDGGGFWNVLIVTEGEPPQQLLSALIDWQKTALSGMLLDWFVRTTDQVEDLNITALKGRPIYLRRDRRLPAWINAIKSDEEKAQARTVTRQERTAETPWYV